MIGVRMLLLLFALTLSASQSAAIALAGEMQLGTNFWNPSWHRPDDCFRDVNNVASDDGNPWNPQFLREIAVYRSFRFMDWDHTNGSLREKWAQRPRKSGKKQSPVAYEWMIDLCNRSHADLWLTAPHRTVDRSFKEQPSDYALRLCLLVKTGIDMGNVDFGPLHARLGDMTADELVAAGGVRTGPALHEDLRLYMEYSNETWNGAFPQSHYCCGEGQTLGLDEDRWTAGFRYHAWAAIRVFRAADLVFGANSPRTVKVLATQSANDWIAGQHLQVLADPRYNPWQTSADAIAIAPYFGHGVDGASSDAVAQLSAAIESAREQTGRHRRLADVAGLRLLAYEGGQHVTINARAINTDARMFELYHKYLDAMSEQFDHFSHYCHVGSAANGGAWGAVERTGQPVNEAPKYRALMEFAENRRRR